MAERAVPMVSLAFCPVCRGYHNATELAGDAFEAMKEDAQSGADYFLLDEHVNAKTGQKCEGTGKTPEYLAEDEDEDDGNYLDPGDINDDEREQIFDR